MKKVAIFGVPRSGTSWIGQIFNSSPQVAYRYQPLFSYSFHGSISPQDNSSEIKKFHKELYNTDDSFVCQTQNLSGNETPTFQKGTITHLVWKEVRYLNVIQNLLEKSHTKVIGIVRHPCGVINSWKNAPREFDKNWNILEEWKDAKKKNTTQHDFYGYERWLEATKMFLKLREDFPDQFHIQLYEKLAYDPLQNTQKLFNFTGIPMNNQTKSFIRKSTSSASDDPYDVYRKNKTGFEWKKQLDSTIINEIKNDTRFIELENNFEWNTLEQIRQ